MKCVTCAFELAVSSYLSQLTRVSSNSQSPTGVSELSVDSLNLREGVGIILNLRRDFYGSYKEREENFALINRWEKEKKVFI